MIRAVVWKEFREQWIIGLTLVVLGGGVLVAAATLGDPPAPGAGPLDVIGSLGVGRLATLMLVVTAGTVCGGALFAAEREAGTLTFLEVLPGTRWALWRAKVAAGALLALAQVLALLAVAAAMGLATPMFAGRLVVYGALAFVWGALGSTVARTTLGSVGVAVPAAVLAMFVYLIPISLAFAPRGTTLPRPVGWLVFEALMLLTPLALSGWWFTATDRERRAGLRRPASGARALVWLAVRQTRVTALVLSAFALAFGFALLLPGMRPVFVWPALALTAGALAGVTAFGDEQVHRTGPFWAENRLPVGRAWGAKVLIHLGLVVWLLLLLLLPGAVRAQFEGPSRFSYGRSTFAAILHDRMFDELGAQAWKYLLVPAAYGFAAGHLCGLVFRKLVVACGVALVVGGCLAALWGPSLLAGGVQHWQVWLPALALLLTGRLAVRPWASDRLTRRGPLRRVAGGTAAALLVLAVGIGFRVLEVPAAPDGEDDIAFVDALPSYDANISGREFKAAVERYARAAAAVEGEPEGQAVARLRPRAGERLEAALRLGWSGSEPELGAWLDRLFADGPLAPGDRPWHALLDEAAAKPLGVFESPQLTSTPAATAAALDNARRAAVALLARGLQQQAAGAPGAFWPRFATALALARNMQNGGGLLALAAGLEVERLALSAAERWLERYPGWLHRQAARDPGGPDPLLRAAARAVEGYETGGEHDLRRHHLADRYVVRELMRAPNQWLPAGLTPAGGAPEQVSAEVDLVGFAWAVPWERERTRRLVGLGFERAAPGAPAPGAGLLAGRPGAHLLLARNRASGDIAEADRYVLTLRRAVALKLAVRAYLSETGAAPPALADLTAGAPPYLTAVPGDPHADGRPFGYRVSAGETLRGAARGPTVSGANPPAVVLQPGQVVLWSVGPDGADQGGTVAPGGQRSEDLVFLVPMFGLGPK